MENERFPEFGCVIMASGLGRRFGGNKLMAPFLGAPLISRILSATEAFQNRVVVTRHEAVARLCREQGISVVLHSLPYRSDTVRLGLEALPELEGVLFCPGDQPLISADTLAALAERSRQTPDAILRPCYEGEPGAPILFPKWAFPELKDLPQGKGGGFLAKKYPEKVHMLPVQHSWELMDADTPEVLQELERIAAEHNL